jgi:hypothetical protein
MGSKIYPGVFSSEEINSIIDFYESKPITVEDFWAQNKNLEYHIPEDFSYQLLNPKLTAMLGEHEFATGAYKECVNPYALHTDSFYAHNTLGNIVTFAQTKKHNKALLIPLVEGLCYKTVTFACYSDDNNFQLDPWLLQEKNSLDPEEFTHCDKRISHLPLEIEYTWKLGDVLCWDRDQVHASANFARHGVTKKFLVLFIA